MLSDTKVYSDLAPHGQTAFIEEFVMIETILSRSIRVICLGGISLGMQAATAQSTGEPMQRVEVTGSRIRQIDRETAQPLQVITAAQIRDSGLVTLGDILNSVSSAGAPDFSRGSALGASRENGGQYINLRNLGSNRLLTLVNGKRWTQTVDGFTDMSTIPASMVERIEVLKDGASSIYGSDAIAGVVNIILKKSMRGGELSLYSGRNKYGDGRNKDFSLSYGAGNEQVSLMFGLSHTEQGVIWAATRPVTASAYGPLRPAVGLGLGPWARIVPVDPRTGGALPSEDENGAAMPGFFDRVINHTGTFDGIGIGGASRNPAHWHDYAGADEDKFNATQQMMFQMPNTLDSIIAKGSIKLPKNMRISTTALFAQRSARAQVAGYPLQSGSQAGYPVYVDRDSYFNPYGNQVAGSGHGQDLYFYRRTTELPRVTENENRTVHVDAALDGEFSLRDLPWNWTVGVNYNKVSGSILTTGNLNLPKLKKALGPSFMNAAGTVQCGSLASPIPLAECVPFDILGGPSASTAQALAYVMSTGHARYGGTTSAATADVSAELLTLPAGPLAMAAGVEQRAVRGHDQPGQFEQSGYSTDLAGNSTFGRYTVKEAYAELNIPVLKGVTLAELLSFNLAARHSDYSNFGRTTNRKASFVWKPVNDLLARATYAEGFRAPNIGDTFGGGQQSYDEYLDPCDSLYGEAAINPEVQARCIAAGVPAGFRQVDQTGMPIISSQETQSTTPFMSGAGNASLTPETSVTRSMGLVYSPSSLPGFSAGIDWYRIQVDNRIVGVAATYVADQCYIAGVTSFCGAIQRHPATGEIVNLAHGNANLGQLRAEGADLALTYRLPPNRLGLFVLRTETSYVDKFAVKSAADGGWVNHAGEYAYHRLRSNLTLDWSSENWKAGWGLRYYSPVKDECWDVQARVECNLPDFEASWGQGANKLGATTYHDLHVSYKTAWQGQIQLGVNNIFGKKPRITYQGGASSSSVDADLPLDRFFYARYTQSF